MTWLLLKPMAMKMPNSDGALSNTPHHGHQNHQSAHQHNQQRQAVGEFIEVPQGFHTAFHHLPEWPLPWHREEHSEIWATMSSMGHAAQSAATSAMEIRPSLPSTCWAVL